MAVGQQVSVEFFGTVGMPLNYAVPDDLRERITVGSLVEVPLLRKLLPAIVTSPEPEEFSGKLRPIQRLIRSEPVLNAVQMALVDWAAFHYQCARSALWDISVPAVVRRSSAMGHALPSGTTGPPPGFSATLVDGLEDDRWQKLAPKIADTVHGGQVLILCPSVHSAIGLHGNLAERFGLHGSLWHGAISQKQRLMTWEGLRRGEISLLIGCNAAIFLPMPRQRLIVVEREEDTRHLTETHLRYNGRELAICRSMLANIPCILSSAAPSAESLHRIGKGTLHHIRLPCSNRPTVQIVDLGNAPNNQRLLSDQLIQHVKLCRERDERAVLLHSRRGLAHLRCPRCGNFPKCPNCGISLFLERGGIARCPRCPHSIPAPKRCPRCAILFRRLGAGTQRLEEICQFLFPGVRCVQWNRETGDIWDQPDWDLLLCTAQPPIRHSNRPVSLIAVLDVNCHLQCSHFRGGEWAMQHLVDLCQWLIPGNGRLLIQTHDPNDELLQDLCRGNWEDFLRRDMESRKLLAYPPHRHLVCLELTGPHENDLQQAADRWANFLRDAGACRGMDVHGPATPVIPKGKGRFRREIWLLVNDLPWLAVEFAKWRSTFGPLPPAIRETVAVDPLAPW
jgi:primosomal protein N' (replication factor Y)